MPCRSAAAAALLFIASACTETGPTTPVASRIGIETAPSSSVANRATLAVQPRVRLLDAAGQPVPTPGIIVSVGVSTGSSLIGTTTATTDASGVATFSGLSLAGATGTRTLTFSANGLASTTATVSVAAGAPATFAINAGDNQNEAEGIAVAVRPSVVVTDADANGVPGIAITFAVIAGAGSITGATVSTDAQGIATVGSWALGAAGPNRLGATASGSFAPAIELVATAIRLPVASVVVSGLSVPLLPGATAQLAAVTRDSVGRTVAGRAVVWSSTAPDTAKVGAVDGLATGVLPGGATIAATSEGKTGTLGVSVVAPKIAAVTTIGITGHLGAAVNNGQSPPAGFEHGFGYYTSIHPLDASHARGMQLGWGTWLQPNNNTFTQPLCPVGSYARDNWPERGPTWRDVYQNIEGGSGEWVSTRFPAAVSKFRINATPDCYGYQVASSGWTFGGDLLPDAKLGLAQLANRLIIPPDGLTFIDAAGGTMFGNAWIALPLIPASTPAGGVPTGDQSYTFFAHASNFRGAVAFYTPEIWSAINAVDATGVGRGHDARPMFAGGLALEIGQTPSITSQDSSGTRYRRVPRVTFPAGASNEAVLQLDARYYSKQAIWNAVDAWMQSGTVATQLDAAGAFTPTVAGSQLNLTLGGAAVSFGTAFSPGTLTGTAGAFGLRWTGNLPAGVFPEYYKEVGTTWVAIPQSQVPRETWLIDQTFDPLPKGFYPIVSQAASSPWAPTRWSAGPFTATLTDGSIVDYVWFKFVDQPAIARLGLSVGVRAKLQAFAESYHQVSGTNGVTIAPPSSGRLATIDPAQIVTPPPGLEKGYVPIVIRQR